MLEVGIFIAATFIAREVLASILAFFGMQKDRARHLVTIVALWIWGVMGFLFILIMFKIGFMTELAKAFGVVFVGLWDFIYYLFIGIWEILVG